MLHKVRSVLSSDGELLEAEELLDVLWLAAQLPPAAATALVRAAATVEPPSSAADRTAGAAAGHAVEPSPEDGDEDGQRKASPTDSGTGSDSEHGDGLHAAPAAPEQWPGHSDQAAMAVRTPGMKALEGAELRLGRALRPLKQLRPDPLRTELDVNATVSAMAETGLPEAVLRPAQTRWLDLTVLVDDGVSMLLWQRLAGELRGLLERCGAFRHVRVHGLDSRSPTGPRLSGRPYGKPDGTLPMSTVLDPSGNTLLLVVSDGVGRAWRDGAMHKALLRAASAGPTAVVHTLPRRLWAGSGIDAVKWRVTTRRRGAANRSWHIEDLVLPPDLAPYDGVPVPVLATDGSTLGTWAQLIGSPGDTAVLPLLTQPDSPTTTAGEQAFSRQNTVGDAEEAVLRFRGVASPDAYRLAAHLAAVAPLPVPVMRLVQHAVDPAVDTSHLAEVFLGGLMHGVDVSEDLPHQKIFDFTEETRSVLLGTVPPADLVRTTREVAAHLAELTASSVGFPAWLPHPEGRERVSSGTRGPFGWLDDTLKRRLGASLSETPDPEPNPPRLQDELRELPEGFVELSVVQLAASRERVSLPHQVGVIPPRAKSFQHRAEAEQLRAAVDGGGTAVLCQVLTGTGGGGKTQLAADFARAVWDSRGVDVLVWISASTRPVIVAGYAQAGTELLGADPQDPEQAAKTFLAWLEPKPGVNRCRWLVVLDDLADPADLRGLWPPTSPSGRTLVTTRRRDANLSGPGRRSVTVGLFTPDEATTYLTTTLTPHRRHESANELTALAADLGHLPLALALAAAYLIDTGIDCATYRQLLTDRARTLTDVLPEPDALPDAHATTTAAAWSLSIERANRLRPAGLASPMLQLTSILDPNGIPASVLTAPAALDYLTKHRTPGQKPSRSERPRRAQDASDALRCLHQLSLIDTPPTPHQTVRVHNLIQRTVRDTLSTDQHKQLTRAAADALTDIWPKVERDTALAGSLRANAEALISQAKDALWDPDAHPVLYRTGTSLGESGQVTAAAIHFQHLAATAHHRLGPDHPDTLSARGSLAFWRGEAGDAAGAVEAFAGLLTDQERVLGHEHPHTLSVRNDLASCRGRAGDVAGAVEAFAGLLTDQERVLGHEHPSTLVTRGNLAFWRGRAGDAAGAVEAFAGLLADLGRVLGHEHPSTLVTRGNLAFWRGEAGDVAGAVEAFAGLLADLGRVLGHEHPSTLVTRGNL
ncbi:SAV_2336 N-terminal domain-related protein, partial [Streptomyces sp. NPDC001933]|uniref:SAV_2336 N-terminal domain-related protein n=1 Tax=Streptomyces sp. NPDC001933 TaxID=3364626 RepID=UPI0036C72E78